MELPQSRPYGPQGRKPTHNFLSLYSPAQQHQSSTPPGVFFETHDFLQPLEREGKNKLEEPTAPVEHILPGGIGTYSISHISGVNKSESERIRKAEGVVITATQSSGSDKNDENSNSSSYTGSDFSLWEESGVKGKTEKENVAGNRRVIREGSMKTGGVPWMTSTERPSQSSSAHNHPTASISSLSSPRPSSAQKNPIFVDMLKSSTKEDEDDEQQEFIVKKEPSSYYKDTTHHDQKPNTSRSKHSATEQRRRSKINDRFLMLRQLIPHGDQKRDKASFLLEVFEYIRFLQEKVHKYEDSCENNNYNQRPPEGFMDQQLVQTGGIEPTSVKMGNGSLNYPPKGQTLLDSDLSSNEQIGCLTNKGSSFPAPLPSTVTAKSAKAISQLKDQENGIESGTISISTIYSQRLLSTLTQALQNSGVDMSQANISVQIDLGNRANLITPVFKKNDVYGVNETLARSRLASTREEKSDNALKRFKTNRN